MLYEMAPVEPVHVNNGPRTSRYRPSAEVAATEIGLGRGEGYSTVGVTVERRILGGGSGTALRSEIGKGKFWEGVAEGGGGLILLMTEVIMDIIADSSLGKPTFAI
jgi:hypothetical protein